MSRREGLRLWGRCLWRCRLGAALYLLSTLLFALVMGLYGAAAEGIRYGLLLSLVLGLVGLLVISLRLYGKARALQALSDALPDSLAHLPSASGPVEEAHQALLRELARRYRERVTQDDQRYEALTAYYTLWGHQIKTPIAAMGLLLNREDSAQARQLQSELLRTEQYVDMALNYLRLQAEVDDFRFEQLALRELVSEAARRFAAQFVHKRLSLAVTVPEERSVLSDRKWLRFVVEQLLANALKYTEQGGITIRWAEDREELCIADTGRGIRPEDLPRVFDLGFTGYTGRVDQRATGIGLTLCRDACRRLNHSLRIESALGQGTRVFIGFSRGGISIE